MATPMPKGRIVWFDCMTSDAAKTESFYTQLIGWTITPFDMGNGVYKMWTNDGVPQGGIMAMPPETVRAGTPSHWMMYVGTPDVAATVKQAEGLGARVFVKPTDIPTVGTFAVLADPAGAVFAVFCATEPAGDPVAPATVGEFSWFELGTTDVAKDFGFYEALFGWERREAHDMGPLGIYQLWSRPGWHFPIGGAFNRPPQMAMSAWVLYIRVADLDAACAAVTRLGGTIVYGPTEVPGGDRIAQGTDPTGAWFALHWTKGA